VAKCLLPGVMGILLPWNLRAEKSKPDRAGTSPEVSISGNLPGKLPDPIVFPVDIDGSESLKESLRIGEKCH